MKEDMNFSYMLTKMQSCSPIKDSEKRLCGIMRCQEVSYVQETQVAAGCCGGS